MNAQGPLVFFGSGAFGLPTLQRLRMAHEVRAVVTQPDKPAGRSRRPASTPIGAWSEEHLRGTLVLKPENVNDARVMEEIRGLGDAVFVVIAFGQKLSAGLLEGRFAINLHASLLPRWRGAAPINHAVLAGDLETGNSVITLAQRMDAGLILGQSRRGIEPHLTAGDLHDLLAADGPELVMRVLDARLGGGLESREQDGALVTPAPKFSKADGWLDFNASAEECRRRIHGLNPWPGVTVGFRGEGLKLLRAACVERGAAGETGLLADAARGIVRCGGGTMLELVEVQPEGGRAMVWSDFARGKRPLADEPLVGGVRC